MRNHQRQIVIITEVLLFLAFCNGCKKYPENNLWFKNPEKLDFFYGQITNYKVNEIDSLALLNAYYNPTNTEITNGDIRKGVIINSDDHQMRQIFFKDSPSGYGLFGLSYSFDKKKKNLKIKCDLSSYNSKTFFQKNIFIGDDVIWKVVKLPKKRGEFKIETTLANGNKYEITINR